MSLINRMDRFLIEKLTWNLLVTAICLGGVIGIALKFITLFDNWLFFPLFPNIFDSIFLIFSAIFLTYNSVKRKA
jgi:hypothetical protein